MKTIKGDPGAEKLHLDFLKKNILTRLEICLLNGKKCAEIQKLLGQQKEIHLDEDHRTPFQND